MPFFESRVINLFCKFTSIRDFYLVYSTATGKANSQDIDRRTAFSRRLALSEPWEEGKSRRGSTARQVAGRQVFPFVIERAAAILPYI